MRCVTILVRVKERICAAIAHTRNACLLSKTTCAAHTVNVLLQR